MATNYPSSLDSLSNPATTDPVNNPSHAVQHANANDAIEALQAKVGTNNSAVSTSIDYRVRQLETLELATQTYVDTAVQNLSNASDLEYVPIADVGAADGVAPLDSGGKIPDSYIPAGIARDTEVSTAIANLVNSAPSTLDTLSEIATALGNDANLSTTLTNAISGKVSKSGGDTITPSSASVKGLIIKGAASQTANLQEWHRDDGVALLTVSKDGDVTAANNSSTAIRFRYFDGINISGTFWDTVASNSATFIGRSTSAATMVIKGAASQTANLQEWQNSSGTVLTSVDKDGYLQTPRLVITNGGNIIDSAGTTPYFGFGSNQIAIYTRNAAYKGLIIQGSASQTANLQEWQNSSGTVLAKVDSSGKISAPIFQSTVAGTAYIVTGSNNNAIRIQTNAVANVGLQVRGETSQTANLQEWQNSAGTVLTKIAADGQLSVGSGTSNYLSTYDAYGNITSRTAGTNYSANISVLTGATSYIGMVIRGQSGQTANLQEWQNSAGNTLAYIRPNGSAYFSDRISGDNGISISNASGFGGWVAFTNNAIVGISTIYSSSPGLIIRGVASQTANLQEWQNSAGTVLASVNSAGKFVGDGSLLTGISGGLTIASVNSNITLQASYRYFVDTTAARTLTLPASPALGTEIQILDASGTAGTYNITVSRNGNLINGNAGNLLIDTNGGWYTLVYTGSTYGWKVG